MRYAPKFDLKYSLGHYADFHRVLAQRGVCVWGVSGCFYFCQQSEAAAGGGGGAAWGWMCGRWPLRHALHPSAAVSFVAELDKVWQSAGAVAAELSELR